MFRKMITLLLFVTTVPMAVFGQHNFKAEQVKTWFATTQNQTHDKWPAARKHLEKSLPDAVQGLATRLNSYTPSAGHADITAPYCAAVTLWQSSLDVDKSKNNFSI